MPKVSSFYSLGLTQPSLEFLDVDTVNDTKVFVDPHAFHYLSSDWGRECVSLLEDFYTEALHAVRSNDKPRGLYVLSQCGESDETHLGLSEGVSQGGGIGPYLAEAIFDALQSSRAVSTGYVTDLEDTVLFVEGIGHDRVSDMTINVVRAQLIDFTQRMCDQYGIDLVDDVDSGPMWNRHTHAWEHKYTRLPMPNGNKLLLVPKAIVRKNTTFDPGEYLQHFVLPYLQEVELRNSSSPLIQRRSPTGKYRGQKFVTKKSIVARDGKPAKEWNTDATDEHPQLLDEYRASRGDLSEPPDHEEIAALTSSPLPDWDALLASVLSIPSGRDHADDYHRAVQHLLTALFYPALDMPVREFPTHNGRKRIDIMYSNMADSGFFHWLGNAGGVECGIVVVECKNYTGKLKNPEFDQLTGRFSPRRGRFGLLLYRGFKDSKADVIQHCRDAALDDRGYVIALDDADLTVLVEARKNGDETMFRELRKRYLELI